MISAPFDILRVVLGGFVMAVRAGSREPQRLEWPGAIWAPVLGKVLWFVVAGSWLTIGYFSSALACFITIVGIPFGIQHIKLAMNALAPVGMTVVPVHSRP